MSDSHAGWQRLAALLSDRRTRLDPQYKSRLKFAADTGLNERLIADLENARRSSYRPTTLGAVETAYRWAPGSIDRVLAGGEPVEVAVVSATTSIAATSHAKVGARESDDQTTEGLEAALRELARRLSPDRVRALLEEVAPPPKEADMPAAERRYEDDAEQHLWETPGLDERERRYLIHQLESLRRFDEADRSQAERPSADVHEFRRRG